MCLRLIALTKVEAGGEAQLRKEHLAYFLLRLSSLLKIPKRRNLQQIQVQGKAAVLKIQSCFEDSTKLRAIQVKFIVTT
jgi:hypothetical protein